MWIVEWEIEDREKMMRRRSFTIFFALFVFFIWRTVRGVIASVRSARFFGSLALRLGKCQLALSNGLEKMIFLSAVWCNSLCCRFPFHCPSSKLLPNEFNSIHDFHVAFCLGWSLMSRRVSQFNLKCCVRLRYIYFSFILLWPFFSSLVDAFSSLSLAALSHFSYFNHDRLIAFLFDSFFLLSTRLWNRQRGTLPFSVKRGEKSDRIGEHWKIEFV